MQGRRPLEQLLMMQWLHTNSIWNLVWEQLCLRVHSKYMVISERVYAHCCVTHRTHGHMVKGDRMYTCICHGQSCCAHEGDCHRITGVASDLHTLAPFPGVSLLLLSKHIPFFSLISCHSLHPFPPFSPSRSLRTHSEVGHRGSTVYSNAAAGVRDGVRERERWGHIGKNTGGWKRNRQPCIIFLLILTTTVLQENKYARAHTHTNLLCQCWRPYINKRIPCTGKWAFSHFIMRLIIKPAPRLAAVVVMYFTFTLIYIKNELYCYT